MLNNNRGQSLVLFVITLPVLLIVLVMVIDIGRVISFKQELNNISELVLNYGLDYLDGVDIDNIDTDVNNINDNVNVDSFRNNNLSSDNIDDRLIEMIKLNKNNLDYVDVRIVDNKIYIELSDRFDGIFSSIIDISVFNVKLSYVGYIDNNEKRIERVNG